MTDIKFSIALHILVFIAEAEQVASSEVLAESVGINASYIRKITSLLKKAGLISSQQGKSGFQLSLPAEQITLDKVYLAVYPDKQLLHVHEDPNPACPIGQHIGAVLNPLFSKIEQDLLADLAGQNLSLVIKQLYQVANQA